MKRRNTLPKLIRKETSYSNRQQLARYGALVPEMWRIAWWQEYIKGHKYAKPLPISPEHKEHMWNLLFGKFLALNADWFETIAKAMREFQKRDPTIADLTRLKLCDPYFEMVKLPMYPGQIAEHNHYTGSMDVYRRLLKEMKVRHRKEPPTNKKRSAP